MLKEIKKIYAEIKPAIESRLDEFDRIWKYADDRELFIELAFCLMTPQSGARVCWKAINLLLEKNLLFSGDYDDIREALKIVRFRNNKAGYLMEAREKYAGTGKETLRYYLKELDTVISKRDWLVKNVKGIGYKEASHFLRNIGLGNELAILDRHILKNMKHLNIIDAIPKTISPNTYKELENKLIKFSKKIRIPADHLDFLLWYKETGDIFK